MALIVGTNCGFVTEAPVDDPGGSTQPANSVAWGIRDTSPANAAKITEIGWWCDNATIEANFEVGIYTNDAGNTEPEDVVGIDTTNAKGTDAGWKRVTGLNISISSETIYWICVQLDATSPQTSTDYASDVGEKQIWTGVQSELPDPTWDIGGEKYSEKTTVYAVWEVAPVGTNMKIDVSGWKDADELQIKVTTWKAVNKIQQMISGAWKTVFG